MNVIFLSDEAKFDLFYELDDWLLLNHSMGGSAAIGVVDVMLLSYLRRV